MFNASIRSKSFLIQKYLNLVVNCFHLDHKQPVCSTSSLVEKAFILISGGTDTLSIVEEASLSFFLAILIASNVVLKHAHSVI